MTAGDVTAPSEVALRKESVDRNTDNKQLVHETTASLSARRAWIEMTSQVPTWFGIPSLSARRAWIEMLVPTNNSTHTPGRSPQGERG